MRVVEGSTIDVTVGAHARQQAVAADAGVHVNVVHEQSDLVVVDKPAGLVVHPGAGNRGGTLVQGLLARYPEIASVGDPARPGIVHRIDKDTSGLLVVARSVEGFVHLSAQVAAHTLTRRYLALVWGHLEAARGMIDAPIGRSARRPTRMAVSTGGRDARTSYEVLETYDEPAPLSLLACTLDTGRTHQIRVHLETIGNPVVGDRRYGGHREPFADLRRFFLHAEHLELDDPASCERLAFDSPLPPELDAVVSQLRARAAHRGPSPPRRPA
jgi:23S rRNA pseudouridine1911/1915/1917 synthase